MGKKSSPKTTTSTSTTKTELPPEVRQLISLATPYIQSGLSGYKPYTGERVAGLTPEQQMAIDALNIGSGYAANTAGSSYGAYNAGLGYLVNPMQNPAFGGAVDSAIRPITNSFLQTVLPNIRTSAVSNGQYGGSRQDIANNLATQSYLRQVGDTSSQMTYDLWNRGMQTGLQTLAMEPQVLAGFQAPASMLGAAGTAKQAQAQAENDAAMQAYYEKTLMPMQLAMQALGAAAGIPGGGSTTSSTAPTGMTGPSTMQRLLSGGLGGAALGSMLPAVGGPIGAGIGAILSLF